MTEPLANHDASAAARLGRSARRPLTEALGDPAFTPRLGDLQALLGLLAAASPKDARVIEAAILRMDLAVVPGVVGALGEATPPLRGRLIRLLGRWASTQPGLVDPLLAALGDPDAKSRRNAIIALGKLLDPRIPGALLAAAAGETRLPLLRSLVDALGKVGGEAALAWLAEVGEQEDHRGDRELRRLLARARLIAVRDQRRQVQVQGQGPGQGLAAVNLGAEVAALPVGFRCRRGLEELLVGELQGIVGLDEVTIDPTEKNLGAVTGRFTGQLCELWRARLALEVFFPCGCFLGQGPPARREEAAITACLGDPGLRRRIVAMTRGGSPRYRLDLEGGHRRRAVWELAAALTRVAPELDNDPQGSTWEVRSRRQGPGFAISLVPRAVTDPRFAYRRGDVPAASHPTIAAALARLVDEGRGRRGPRGPAEIVWDPFVGSGLELCERGLLAPGAVLWGSDIDPQALAIAAVNLEAAGHREVHLLAGDARTLAIPGGVTTILSNPPLGRRVHRGGAQSLLCEALPNLAGQLRRGGCLVWITPDPAVTGAAARACGLVREQVLRVDLGGFAGTAERWRRPA